MGVVENVKEMAELIKKLGDIDLNRKILTLETEVLDLTRDKRRAEEKVEELERALKFNKELTFKPPFYWLDGDTAPYCPGCWESKRLAIHLSKGLVAGAGWQMQCPSCKHSYRDRGV